MLTNYNGTAITYDAIGNPLRWRNGANVEWSGRQMTLFANNNGTVTSYVYNSDGIRTQKVHYDETAEYVGTTKYTLDGTKIVAENRLGTNIYYTYDDKGSVMGMIYGGQYYLFSKNLQGDVIGIYDESGTLVAKYEYSAFGEIISVTDLNGSDIANINPFRYRGYYYDTETGFYYLQTRYYDPVVGRFVNRDTSDILTATPTSLTDKNLFAYCDNNPVIRIDADGQFWDFISLAMSIVDVCKDPSDGWAWAGLVGDVVDVLPFVTCVGESIKAIGAANKVINAADNVHDVAKAADKVDDVVDGVKIAKATDLTDEAKEISKTLDRSSGYTKSTKSAGQKIHEGYKSGSPFNPDWKEYREIPGIRPDYVDFNSNTIFELKPNNPRSIRQGINQLHKYDEALGGGFTLVLELY